MIIVIGIIGIIFIAILLKILSKHFMANLVFMGLAAIGIIVSSFAMPHISSGRNIDWNWVIAQGLFIFLFCTVSCADFAFEKEDYVSTTGRIDCDDDHANVNLKSKLETRSFFWSVIIGSFIASAVLLTLNYMIFETHAIALGIVGCIALAIVIIVIAKWKYREYRYKHPKHYY